MIEDYAYAIIKGGNYVNKTRLQKYGFLSEIEYIENTGRRLSPLTFFSWNHGPFSNELQNTALTARGISVKERTIIADPTRKETIFEISGYEPWGKLSESKMEFVEIFCGSIKDLDNNPLIAMAKDVGIYKDTPFGKPIDLDGYAEQFSRIFERMDKSAKLKSIIQKSETSRRQGKWKSYHSCVDALRNTHG